MRRRKQGGWDPPEVDYFSFINILAYIILFATSWAVSSTYLSFEQLLFYPCLLGIFLVLFLCYLHVSWVAVAILVVSLWGALLIYPNSLENLSQLRLPTVADSSIPTSSPSFVPPSTDSPPIPPVTTKPQASQESHQANLSPTHDAPTPPPVKEVISGISPPPPFFSPFFSNDR